MADSSGRWQELIARRSAAIEAAGQWRRLRTYAGVANATVSDDAGRRLVSFASNDYLGFAHHPAVAEAAIAAIDAEGTGAGASRLVGGSRAMHRELERELASWKGAESALVFSTGYMANIGVLCALGGGEVTILSDALNHASIIDGTRLARASVEVFPHLDLERLEEMLTTIPPPVLVVSESVFSMDGDLADVAALGALCAAHGAALLLDSAHHVLGESAATLVPTGSVLLEVGTLSKTLGALGGFVAGPRAAIELVANLARPFIFTTALPPGDAAAALAALRLVRSAEGASRRARLAANLAALDAEAKSQIVPIVLGSESRALAASRALREEGFLVPAIRPPTVPPGTSRLRLSLSALHDAEEVEGLVAALGRLGVAASARRVARTSSPAHAKLVAVVGTATEVGKTVVGAELLGALKAAGRRVVARKALQSYGADGDETDADRLGEASGEAAELVCPKRWSYPLAMAPVAAAPALGRELPSAAELLAWLGEARRSGAEVAVVELLGGVASPVTADANGLDLLAALHPDELLLVASPELGVLNEVTLAVAALRRRLPGVATRIVLNRFDSANALHRANLEWLVAHLDLPVIAGDPAGRRALYATLAERLR